MKTFSQFCLWCACSVLLSGSTQAAHATDEQETIRYEVALEVPSGQRKLLEEHLDLYRWRDNARMTEAQLRRLVRLAPEQVRDFLATEGFYSPRIDAEIRHQDSLWEVRLVVDPRESVRVTGFDLQLTGSLDGVTPETNARLERMRSVWSLRPDMVFRQEDWETAKRDALRILLLDGYPSAAIVNSRATVNPQTHGVELQVILDSGPAFTFGALEIHGLERYPASLVQRLNPIVAGEPYSQAKLLELQSRLQDSPYFGSADVSVDNNPKRPAGLPIRVVVSENPSQKLGFGIGMSTDTGARGQMDYRDLDFLDRAWQLGGALKLEQKRQTFGGDLQLPPTEEGHRDSINPLIERTNIAGQITQKLAVEAKRTLIRGKTETTIGLRYLTERLDIEGRTSQRRATLSPSYSWTLRNVNDVLDPTRGYLLNLETNVALRALLSDQTFLRGFVRGVSFHSLGSRDLVILRGELGAVASPSRSGIPSDFLFRTGGDQTVRGYAYQSLGVHESGAIVGGRYLLVASVEYVHWLTEQWGLAAFGDAGGAADSFRDLAPAYGYGLGGRWKSPVGPLNLDLAYGQKTRELRLHFSLGFAF